MGEARRGQDGRRRDLPLTGAIFEGKHVEGEFTGTVKRLGRRRLEAALDTELAVLINVRVRLTWPDGRRSGDVYGKVTGGGEGLTRIHLTSVDATDEATLATLVTPASSRSGGVSNGAEERR